MLSIRTQDRMALVPYKETIKVKIDPKDKHFSEAHKEIGMFNKERKLKEISSYSLITRDTTLGTYATKERALEVLDEIEIAKYDLWLATNGGMNIHEVRNTYQMPKE